VALVAGPGRRFARRAVFTREVWWGRPSVVDKILAGVTRFQTEVFPAEQELFESIAHAQRPRALFITCSDSRVHPNLITQTQPGELFLCRDVGNIVPAYGTPGGVSATIEYAVAVLEVRHVIICGHSDCGAMRAALHPENVEELPSVRAWIRNADAARRVVLAQHPGATDDELWQALITQNVISQLINLRTHPSVAVRLATGDLDLHGWTYDIPTGAVSVYDEIERSWFPAAEMANRLH
jgi:carbonic anhydrase